MKWDIDKALRSLTPKSRGHIRIGNETLNSNRLSEVDLRARDESGTADLWFVTFGQDPGPQRTFYGWDIHEACLRATKYLRRAKPLELARFGLVRKPKKLNRYDRDKTKRKPGVQE